MHEVEEKFVGIFDDRVRMQTKNVILAAFRTILAHGVLISFVNCKHFIMRLADAINLKLVSKQKLIGM